MISMFERWQTLGAKLGTHAVPRSIFVELATAYSNPPRAYHTLDHIEQCLLELEGVPANLSIDNPAALEAAIWFHDAIYDPQAHDNEERSADFAAEKLGELGVADLMIAEVRRLILATKHDQPVSGDVALIVDIDLAILGKPPDEFDHYDTAIRLEYSWVPDDLYRVGRSRVLQGFLDRPTIYQTEYFRNRYEAPARLNLQRAIARLS